MAKLTAYEIYKKAQKDNLAYEQYKQLLLDNGIIIKKGNGAESENGKLPIPHVVGQSEQLVCDCGNKLTDKELYFGKCLQCDKNMEEAN